MFFFSIKVLIKVVLIICRFLLYLRKLLKTSTAGKITYAMISFKMTQQADELLYEDHEKMNLISEIMFRKFLQFKTKRHYLLCKV